MEPGCCRGRWSREQTHHGRGRWAVPTCLVGRGGWNCRDFLQPFDHRRVIATVVVAAAVEVGRAGDHSCRYCSLHNLQSQMLTFAAHTSIPEPRSSSH